MKVFITKYALTSGIKELEVTTTDRSPSMVSGTGLFENYHGEGREWHKTLEGAKDRAELMRDLKITSLKKQINKLEKMVF